MTSTEIPSSEIHTVAKRNLLAPRNYISMSFWDGMGTTLFNAFIFLLLLIYLFPLVYMAATAFMTSEQVGDRYSPPYPAEHVRVNIDGEDHLVYNVPMPDGSTRTLALIERGQTSSEFVDPADPTTPIQWEGSWRTLPGVYRFSMTLDNFKLLFDSLPLPMMARNTLTIALVTGVAVLFSSILVAYGFARFPLPGGNLLFYVLIATMLIPEKVTLIPSYFTFVRVLEWNGTLLPVVLPFFFGSAVLIFLLRQNFKSIPKEMEEAAMLDGAGPLRILFQIVLPQSWPVIITAALLHFFYIWNESRLASLYLASNRNLQPISFGVQGFQSLSPIVQVIQAAALITMVVPIVVLLLTQKYFMRNLVITGMEK
jgi:multiple sugar transport system permease protein